MEPFRSVLYKLKIYKTGLIPVPESYDRKYLEVSPIPSDRVYITYLDENGPIEEDLVCNYIFSFDF